MPKGKPINWEKVNEKWLKSNCITLKEFCKKNKISYATARDNIKTTEKQQLSDKLAKKKGEALVEALVLAVVLAGKAIALVEFLQDVE